MPHLNYYLDFTVSVFVVFESRVLLVHHRKLDKWLPVGGHIDPGEDPEAAALRETKEESGLDVELVGERPPFDFPGTRVLTAPAFLDVHHIRGEHHHLGMIYFARARTRELAIAKSEVHAARWLSTSELESSPLEIPEAIRWYGMQAIARLG